MKNSFQGVLSCRRPIVMQHIESGRTLGMWVFLDKDENITKIRIFDPFSNANLECLDQF